MNHRPESKSYNYKTFRENIGVNFCDFGLNNGFLKTADGAGSQPSFLQPPLDSALQLATG